MIKLKGVPFDLRREAVHKLDAFQRSNLMVSNLYADSTLDPEQLKQLIEEHTCEEEVFERELFNGKFDENFKFSCVEESAWHKILEQWCAGVMVVPAGKGGAPIIEQPMLKRIGDCLRNSIASTGVLLLRHDWTAAFKGAENLDEGDIKIPYPITILEGRVNGYRVALLVAEDLMGKKDPVCFLHVETERGWGFMGGTEITRDFGIIRKHSSIPKCFLRLFDALCAQMRAICIALDAEVAETEIIRAPYKLNAKREKRGQLPIFDHHIVNLTHRHRHPVFAPDPNREIHHRRLHFVRGHYRHYEDHKTWIKWFLRGDPDLGFIDKEYKL